ncbi:hypothetical protein JRO89_XS01G0239500 [Xanthoceras sorbifolium]|uniref:3-beta hydroxysteroid dehydrogenase/isomerase domain-containing protein n=1 Tax=Xanthoceras sorbifolium TaxID=99658 RepID=A0ABQ8IKZ8_9ROSI|nr:hypothetical protein JRO89_XS01G0239500 [Xanthoceras sorbifolium]
MLSACAAVVHRRKDDEDFKATRLVSKDLDDDDDQQEKLVCVTSGVSFLGLAIVNRLLLRRYSKSMAEIEVKATENVIKACARASSVRNCVLTSSLLACIWRDGTQQDLSPVVNHDSWSDESLCINNKVYFLSFCENNPASTTNPLLNPTATIAYLKGAQEMYANGLMATVDVMRLAEAHVCVYEAMNKTAFGRYICFDRVIQIEDEAEKLAQEMGMPANKLCGDACDHIPSHFELSNKKLTSLMSRTLTRYFRVQIQESYSEKKAKSGHYWGCVKHNPSKARSSWKLTQQMEDNPPRVPRKDQWSNTNDHNKAAETGPTRKSGNRHTVDDGGDLIECSGKYCRSCTAGLIADCVALCCCPCAVVNILALAFVKIPYKVGKRCLGLGKKKEKEKVKRKCKKVEGGVVVERGENLRKGRTEEEILEIVSSGLTDEEDQEMGAEKVWLELYQVGHLGFGRVSFTGIPSQGKGN